jgi:hypothetical protein
MQIAFLTSERFFSDKNHLLNSQMVLLDVHQIFVQVVIYYPQADLMSQIQRMGANYLNVFGNLLMHGINIYSSGL